MRPANLALVGVLLGGSCLLGLTRGLWTPDEPREAGISRDMYEHPGVIPSLNGEPFIEKPPLYYWTTAFSFVLARGPSVPAARSVSGVAGILTLALLFVWIRRASSPDAAAVAAVLLSTSVAFVTSAHWVRIDALLMAFCTLALWAAWERIGRSAAGGFLALFYAALVLALWTKGLIGPVLIGAGLAVYAAMSKSLRVLAPLRPVAGLAVIGAAIGSLAAAIAATGGAEALRTWFWVNHVERFLHPVATGHERPLLYYLWTLPIAVAPWVVPLLALLDIRAPVWRRDRPDAGLRRYALAMTIGPLLLLSLSSSKREVYLLPLLPPLTTLMAMAILDRAARERDGSSTGRWTRCGDWVQATILALVGLAPAIAHVAYTRQATPVSALFLLLGVAAAALAAIAVARRQAMRGFWIGSASMGLALAGFVALVVPQADAVKNFEPFMVRIDAALPKGEPVRAIGADETLLGIVPFVTGRRVVPVAAGELAGSTFVLVQTSGDDRDPLEAESAYERVEGREFGRGRRIALWRRRAAPSS